MNLTCLTERQVRFIICLFKRQTGTGERFRLLLVHFCLQFFLSVDCELRIQSLAYKLFLLLLSWSSAFESPHLNLSVCSDHRPWPEMAVFIGTKIAQAQWQIMTHRDWETWIVCNTPYQRLCPWSPCGFPLWASLLALSEAVNRSCSHIITIALSN